MRFWLLTIGEPVPVARGSEDRLHRTGLFANLLSESGHDVVWWTSTFDHFRKRHIFGCDTSLTTDGRLEIKLLHGKGYSANLSISRILDHRTVARKFRQFAIQEQRPDLILSSVPTIGLSLSAVRYGQERSIPVVLDMRDMWPDIFVDTVPGFLRLPTRLLTMPMLRDIHAACSGATAIIGITDAFVQWGLDHGTRSRSWKDQAFPMGYVSKPPAMDAINDAERYWRDTGVPGGTESFVVCFVGTLGRQADIETLIIAARALKASGRNITFVVCGTGERLSMFRERATGDSNVLFPGWVNAAQIYVLMRRSVIGLDPLPDRYDFLSTINNKAIEYLSAGLPVVSSPNRGVLQELLRTHECGTSYSAGDADALSKALARLYDDRGTLRKMSRNATRLFGDRFSAERVYADMMAHLTNIAEDRRPEPDPRQPHPPYQKTEDTRSLEQRD